MHLETYCCCESSNWIHNLDRSWFLGGQVGVQQQRCQFTAYSIRIKSEALKQMLHRHNIIKADEFDTLDEQQQFNKGETHFLGTVVDHMREFWQYT